MPRWLSLNNGLDLIAALLALGAGGAVLWTFAIGQHYIIPTAWLVPTLLLGNLARYGLAGARWAKEILFWIGVLMSAHLFMALFFAKTPRAALGPAFEPVFGVLFILLAALTWQYGRRNAVLSRPPA